MFSDLIPISGFDSVYASEICSINQLMNVLIKSLFESSAAGESLLTLVAQKTWALICPA